MDKKENETCTELKIIDENTQSFNDRIFKKSSDGYYFSSIGPIHRVIWSFYNGKIPEDCVIHHKDFDKNNNDISNLQILTYSEHAKVHNAKRRNLEVKLTNEKKFDKIYGDLKNKIVTHEYDFNSVLPSEHELTKTYDCSRSTVRRALSELIQRGYVQVRQGSRVRVIYEPVERNVFKIGGIESFKEAAIRNGFSYDTKVVLLEKIFADEEISARTGFKIDDELFDVRRVRYIDGKALILDKNYFLTSAVKFLTEEIARKSIYEYLENELHMKIMTSKRKMTAELATSEDKKYLELDDYNCLAIVSGRVFNSDGIQFEYTESRHRPDYFCFEDTAIRHKRL